MSGRSFSIILFIIFGENMAKLPRAQKTRSADEKSSQQHLQIGSKSSKKVLIAMTLYENQQQQPGIRTQ